jgi:hypothetical protein
MSMGPPLYRGDRFVTLKIILAIVNGAIAVCPASGAHGGALGPARLTGFAGTAAAKGITGDLIGFLAFGGFGAARGSSALDFFRFVIVEGCYKAFHFQVVQDQFQLFTHDLLLL